MATDFFGRTIATGDLVVPAGEVRKVISASRCLVVVGETPIQVDAADLARVTDLAPISDFGASGANWGTGKSSVIFTWHERVMNTANTGAPYPVRTKFKTPGAAVYLGHDTGGSPAAWLLRLWKNGSVLDTASVATAPGVGWTRNVQNVSWGSGPHTIAAGDRCLIQLVANPDTLDYPVATVTVEQQFIP